MDGPQPFPLLDLECGHPRLQLHWVLDELLDSYDPEGSLTARRDMLIAIRDTLIAIFQRRYVRASDKSPVTRVDLGLTDETQAEMAKLKPRGEKIGRPE